MDEDALRHSKYGRSKMKQSDQKIAQGVLLTDQCQLTMAQFYYRLGLHEKQVQFDHFFRDYPDYGLHQTGYCVNVGLLPNWRNN